VVKRFRTRPVEIDAMQFTGENFEELGKWSSNFIPNLGPENNEFQGRVYDKLHDTWINVAKGQWIVRGAKGEYYPCDDETFHWKYEEVITENQYANGHTYDRT
jgi:hypothetical protein